MIYSSQLTLKESNMLKEKIKKKSFTNNTCLEWFGERDRDGYGTLRFMFRGKRIRVTVHRLHFFLFAGKESLDANMHVSHLCHNKLCLKLKHLSYEPARVNFSRSNCVLNRSCKSHHGYEKCIFFE